MGAYQFDIFWKRIWASPTIMTWLGHTAKALQVIILMPLAFSFLSPEESTVWLIFLTLISLQVLGDMGFTPTFTRALSIAFAGASSLDSPRDKLINNKSESNTKLVDEIVATMIVSYGRLSFIITSILLIIGTALLINPIGKVFDGSSTWIAWGVVLVSLAISFFGNSYIAYLQAIQQIPYIQRLRTVITLAATASAIFALHLGAGLLGLVIAQQVWQIILILCYRQSARKRGMCQTIFSESKINKQVFDYAWSATWRSGLGIFFGYGVIQFSGLVYAQTASAKDAAMYLLLLRLIQYVSMFSQAPFYSKLPVLSRFWANGNIDAVKSMAARGMKISYWVYVIGVLGLGITLPLFFDILGSNVSFPELTVWVLFGIGGLIERFGAMHIQIYSLTNHIVWHVANGISGLLFILTSSIFVYYFGVIGFAVGMIFANLGFYSWYSARYSYSVIDSNFLKFDCKILTLPFIVIIFFLGLALITK